MTQLHLLPTIEGTLTPNVLNNLRALYRARNAYRDEHCTVEYIPVEAYGIQWHSREVHRPRPGAPEFEDYFNDNLDRWYAE